MDLKEISELIVSKTVIDASAVANTSVYVVPVGKKAIITAFHWLGNDDSGAVVYDLQNNGASLSGLGGLSLSYISTGFYQNFYLQSLGGSANWPVLVAGDTLSVNITTPGTNPGWLFILRGILIDA